LELEDAYAFIEADESGKTFLDHFKRQHGESSIVVVKRGAYPVESVEYKETVLERVFDVFNPEESGHLLRTPLYPSGFTFPLDKDCQGKEVFIPMRIPVENPECHLYFAVTEGPFFLVLGNTGDCYERGVNRETFKMRINTRISDGGSHFDAFFCRDCRERKVLPVGGHRYECDVPEDRVRRGTSEFDERLMRMGRVSNMHFHLVLNKESKQVHLWFSRDDPREWGPEFVFQLPSTPPSVCEFNFHHVSFMSDKNNKGEGPTIWNLHL